MKRIVSLFLFSLMFAISGCGFTDKEVFNFSEYSVEQFSRVGNAENTLSEMIGSYIKGEKVDVAALENAHSKLQKTTADVISKIGARKVPESESCKKFVSTVNKYLNGYKEKVDNEIATVVETIKKTNPSDMASVTIVLKNLKELDDWRGPEMKAVDRAQKSMASKHRFKLK